VKCAGAGVPGKPGDQGDPGPFESGLASFADGLTSSFVLFVGCDVADAPVQSHRVVVLADDGEFGTQGGRVADREQVRVLGLEVPVEGLDPGLVGRLAVSTRLGPSVTGQIPANVATPDR